MSKMPPKIILEPTRTDSILGVCNSPHKCMYVFPLRRIFPNAANITVNPNRVSITIHKVYHHYEMTLKGVAGMANFDHDGANISDADLKKAKVTLRYTGSKPASYKGTDAEKEAHRKKSAHYRASPGYVRPDKGKTVRAQVARTYKIPTKRIDNNKDVL